jgi:hypothetical protein
MIIINLINYFIIIKQAAMLLNLTPNLYFRQALRKIRAHELDAALVQLPFDYVLEALRFFSFSFLLHVLEVLRSFFFFFSPRLLLEALRSYIRVLMLYLSSYYYTPVYYSMLAICTNSTLRPCSFPSTACTRRCRLLFSGVRACIFVYTTITIPTIYSLYHYY